MKTQEQNDLYVLGVNTIINVINTIITSTGYGAMVLMMFVAMHYLSKKQRTIPIIALATCCMVIFVLFTVQYIYCSGLNLLAIAAHTDDSPGPQQAASYAQKAQYLAYMVVAASQPGLMYPVGDVIVVWRAWVLLQRDKSYKILLAVLMLANLGISIADIVLDYIHIQSELQGITNSMDWIMCIGLLLINLFAMLLIGWKLWSHQRNVEYLVARSNGHQIQKIMILLIESGALIGITQVMNLVLNIVSAYDSNLTTGFLYTYHVFTALAPVTTAWYPLIVIILVNTGHSPVHATVHFIDSDILAEHPP
ncbi:hypothetical protein D9757_011288 [Collybiopsis confluens]|uniref:Uncharacterized protein n=1 Tax=Collybiopsis confluens TaxID=2823264 RepID=A0A8H5LSV1_9AGAR|nr:hypothetical protein D9757_011288 [Collybiopsis confluens]